MQKGLRTLVVACRHFSPEEYIAVNKRLTFARTALQRREEKLQQAFAYIENNLHLLGATGVEDKYGDFQLDSQQCCCCCKQFLQ